MYTYKTTQCLFRPVANFRRLVHRTATQRTNAITNLISKTVKMVTTNVVELKTKYNFENLSIEIESENLRHLGTCSVIISYGTILRTATRAGQRRNDRRQRARRFCCKKET